MTYEEIKELPGGVVVGSVEVNDSREGDGRFEWLLEKPIRFKNPRKPNPGQRANPVWFFPFGNPDE